MVLHCQLDDRLDPALNGQRVELEGLVTGMPEVHPEYTRIRFQPAPGSAQPGVPSRLLLYWYRDAPLFANGETWRMQVELRPPWGRINFSGNDRERWLFSQGIGALGIVRGGERIRQSIGGIPDWQAWRQSIRDRIASAVPDQTERSIVAALAVADQSGLPSAARETLTRTGTSHLLAISGLNIGLAALFGFWLLRLATSAIPLRWVAGKSYTVCILGGFALAVVHAGLADLGASVLRALIMLGVCVVALLYRRGLHPATALTWGLALVVLVDPLSVLGAGLWLSFIAVGVLLFLVSQQTSGKGVGAGNLFRAQLAIMLVLLPMGAWWFQMTSVSGLLANLVAVPWVSFVVVPVTLTGILLMPASEWLSGMAFLVAGKTSGWLFQLLHWFSNLQWSAFDLPHPELWLAVVATIGGVLLLMVNGLRQRWLAILMFLPLFITEQPPAHGEMRIDVLDVGQGTAVMVTSKEHLLLYDSGPGNGEDFDLVQQVLIPAVVRSPHGEPSRVLISHGDLDHAGGLDSLRGRFPEAEFLASLPANLPGVGACVQPDAWRWDGFDFRILHPSTHLPYLGNDSSCVLSIRSGRVSVLLPGDISSVVEARLVDHGLQQHTVLVAPHHGSKSSSSPSFIEAVSPDVAIATTGAGNRFGFPRPEVKGRYQEADVPLWATGDCGAVRLSLSKDGMIHAQSARRFRAAPWRWPAAETCP